MPNEFNFADRSPADALYDRIIDALKAQRGSLEELQVQDLAPVDHFHALGLAGTIKLADKLAFKPGDHVLDIGCGLGGPARFIAQRFNCHVTGIDINERSVGVANRLTDLLDMGNQVNFEPGDALNLAFPDATFDGGYAQHSTMNLPDRDRFAAEAYRVLKPEATFALSEHGLGPVGEPLYPTPWSNDGTDSFLVAAGETRGTLERAGFVDLSVEIPRDEYLSFYQHVVEQARAGPLPDLGPQLLMGDGTLARLENMSKNIVERRTDPVLVLARKPIE